MREPLPKDSERPGLVARAKHCVWLQVSFARKIWNGNIEKDTLANLPSPESLISGSQNRCGLSDEKMRGSMVQVFPA